MKMRRLFSEEPLMRAGALSTNHEIGDKIE